MRLVSWLVWLAYLAALAWVLPLAGCRSPSGPSVESYAEACESGTLPPDSVLCAECYIMPFEARHDGDPSTGLRVCR